MRLTDFPITRWLLPALAAVSLAAVPLAAGGCDGEDATLIEPAPTAAYTFADDAEGWRVDIADYSDDQAEGVGFVGEHRGDPDDFPGSDGAIFLRGANVSDDLKMYAKRQVGGLEPETRYRLAATVVIGTSVGAGCVGIGGAPGESVVVKVGASAVEPETVRGTEAGDADYVLNVDVGGQNMESRGPNGLSIGDMASAAAPCEDGGAFFAKTLTLAFEEDLTVVTDAQGAAWVLVSTDSGFEGVNRIYLDAVAVTFVEE